MKRVAKNLGVLGLVGYAVMTSQFALADDSGWYGGINIGQSRAKIDDARITVNQVGVAPASIIDDNRGTAYKLFGGYRVNKNFSLEGGYFDLGQFGYTATIAAPAGTLTGKIKLRGVNIDAIGILPITEQFSAFGRVGLNYAQARDNFVNTGAVGAPVNPNPSKRATNYKFGAGLQYDFTESFGMRAEAERYRINDAVGNKGDINMYSLGLVYRFGAKTPTPAPAPRAVIPEPVVVVAAPEPEPAPNPVTVTVIPTAPPPAKMKVVLSADSSAGSFFGFDKATINPSGQQALDKFAADLRGADFDVITVTGHTDRIGSHTYNQKLSTQRAEVVKAYLVESAGIPSDKITAKGLDGADPVTKPGECKGKKVTKELVACLAPDRRVEVEVSATRTSR